MKKAKKTLLKGILSSICGLFGLGSFFALAQNFYYDYNEVEIGDDTTNFGEAFRDDAVITQQGVNYKLRDALKLTNGVYAKSDKKAIDYIKMIINIALGLVAFVSLVLIIFAFYLMFFNEQEEGYTKAKKIIKGVLVAIAIMGVSYFIVSFIFYLYQVTTGAGDTNTRAPSSRNQSYSR